MEQEKTKLGNTAPKLVPRPGRSNLCSLAYKSAQVIPLYESKDTFATIPRVHFKLDYTFGSSHRTPGENTREDPYHRHSTSFNEDEVHAKLTGYGTSHRELNALRLELVLSNALGN
jgi:hypothetical protein